MAKVKNVKTGKVNEKQAKVFTFVSQKEATNNFVYFEKLAKFEGFVPIECYLTERSDQYGNIKDIWEKQVIRSFDFSLEPKQGAIKCICFDVTGIERPRRIYDKHFDNLCHIKTVELAKEKSKVKYLVLKPLDGSFLQMKERTQQRFNTVYEKAHSLTAATK